ncbi:MAG: hypothetical protein P8N52_01280 [Crocinitomicaceae bacterium]|nr:hypothetical protein [Crocinitomicaceae bacterium]MDG1777275.1 hypothetical protein [Crocinitomicaceae bacterium]
MSEENNVSQPQGKSMGVAGFILSLVTLLFSSWIAVLATASIIAGGSGWLMHFWSVLAILSVVLSAMGMSKLGKTGGKKGLAIAGLVIGIVSVIYCLMLSAGISAAASVSDNYSDIVGNMNESIDALNDLNDIYGN